MSTRDVTLRLLRYFEVLGEELNFRRAADRLYISQPALSSAIAQLERLVGVKLLERDTHSVALTDSGHAWLPHVRSALAAVDDALSVVSAFVDNGHVRLGYLIGTGADLVYQLLEDHETALPGISIEANQFDFADPTAGLSSGQSDVVITVAPVGIQGVRTKVLVEDQWVACLPVKHPLADAESVRIEELLDEPIVTAPDANPEWRDFWTAADVRSGSPAVTGGVATTYEEEVTLVSRGVGISFTTTSTARLYGRHGVRFVPIVNRPPCAVVLAWKPQRCSASVLRVVEHMVSKHVSSGAPITTGYQHIET